jgi:hypothetical protein
VAYHSKREAQFPRDLDLLKRARGSEKVESWESQVRFKLMVNGQHICGYVVDLSVKYADGRRELRHASHRWPTRQSLCRLIATLA